MRASIDARSFSPELHKSKTRAIELLCFWEIGKAERVREYEMLKQVLEDYSDDLSR